MTFNDAQEFAESVIFRSVTGKLPCYEDCRIYIWDYDKGNNNLYDLIDNISNSIEKYKDEILDIELIKSPESRGIHYGDDNFIEEYTKYSNSIDELTKTLYLIFGSLTLIRHTSEYGLLILYSELVEFYESH